MRSSDRLTFEFACPICNKKLEKHSNEAFYCKNDDERFVLIDGIWRFLPPQRDAYYQQFIQEYETVRQAEGRGASGYQFYNSLPYADTTGRFEADWKIRSKSFHTFLKKILIPQEKRYNTPLKILDLGSGNGWLSNRLAERHHQLAAIDLLVNDLDGLGACKHYQTPFLAIQAEYSRLPLQPNQVEMVIFNASLHYATDYSIAISEALRVLKPDGLIVILDSPIYTNPTSGEQMVQERQKLFIQRYGFASNTLESENYLTKQRLEELSNEFKLHWKHITPFYGWQWSIRPWLARLRRRRQPARFIILVGKKS